MFSRYQIILKILIFFLPIFLIYLYMNGFVNEWMFPSVNEIDEVIDCDHQFNQTEIKNELLNNESEIIEKENSYFTAKNILIGVSVVVIVGVFIFVIYKNFSGSSDQTSNNLDQSNDLGQQPNNLDQSNNLGQRPEVDNGVDFDEVCNKVSTARDVLDEMNTLLTAGPDVVDRSDLANIGNNMSLYIARKWEIFCNLLRNAEWIKDDIHNKYNQIQNVIANKGNLTLIIADKIKDICDNMLIFVNDCIEPARAAAEFLRSVRYNPNALMLKETDLEVTFNTVYFYVLDPIIEYFTKFF